ncbi:MAG: efflux RND transporter periplasmic adaptor subunit [Pseudobdellovibrionaceae bacterium]|jgi:RND family efflux transporter MFP subunit|nr:efflux RND transporter periplasmic adaptor subunit [Pseudobdellovibrionaceae bacterium]
MARRSIADSWHFHLSVRLIALLVIMLSAYVIIMSKAERYEAGYEAGYQENSIEEALEAVAPADTNVMQASENRGFEKTLSEIYQSREAVEPNQNDFAALSPANGEDDVKKAESEWPVEEKALDVDAVLVPDQETVISSSRDGKISDIPLHNGDKFSKNDILIRYDCSDLEAEAEIAGVEKELTDKKAKTGNQLFKLDIISDVDRLNIETEDKQAAAKIKLYEARLNDCTIKAGFNGRVTKRLANEGEYTRTDRVLLEVVSNDPLHAEFLLPSKWLRWVNIGAPVSIVLNETGRTYTAKIIRIYGEVDPVSRSIQVRAALDEYKDPLLTGMSGKLTLDISRIQDAGVIGYLSLKER